MRRRTVLTPVYTPYGPQPLCRETDTETRERRRKARGEEEEKKNIQNPERG